MSCDPYDSGLAAICDQALGSWNVAGQFPTQRPASSVWRVRAETGQEFVLKKHLTRTRHDREVYAYRYWTPFLDGHAPALVAADGENLAILLQAVPGTPADRAALRTDGQAAMHQHAGELLQQLHNVSLQNLPLTDTPPAQHPAARLQERYAHWLNRARPQLDDDDVSVLNGAARNLADLDHLPVTACHLDYQPHNWIIDAADSTSTALYVVDFEHSRTDIAVRDLVRLEVRYWSAQPQLREAFFDGYGRPLDDREALALLACAAIDAVSSLARGTTTGNTMLVQHARTTLDWLRTGQSHRHRTPARAGLLEQLKAPDVTGRDLELLRTRSYRFSENPHHYVYAEALEDRFLEGLSPTAASMSFVRRGLEQLRGEGTLPDLDPKVTASINLDLDDELLRREPFAYRKHLSGSEPEMVVAVVGAPRSGTSHLVNLLASTGRFAYFTTASCWAWPTRNLQHPKRTLLSHTDRDAMQRILAVDNKLTRVIPGLVMPGEAEDVNARAIPVYQHLGGHRYRILQPSMGDVDVLRAGCAAHLAYFRRRAFLTKSPFNSLRIPILEQIWPGKVRYIQIIRDRDATSESMRRNHFQFSFDGGTDTPERAWDRFVETVRQDAPPERLMTVRHGDVTREPTRTLSALLTWIGQT